MCLPGKFIFGGYTNASYNPEEGRAAEPVTAYTIFRLFVVSAQVVLSFMVVANASVEKCALVSLFFLSRYEAIIE